MIHGKTRLKAIHGNYDGACRELPGSRPYWQRFETQIRRLKEFSIDQVVSAATKLIQIHKYNSMPTVGDVINAMDGVVRINTEQRAEIEAGKVLDHLYSFGSQVTPSFDDPITKHLMSHRWRYHSWASRVKEDDLKWWSRDFVRTYKAHAVAANAGFYLPVNSVVQRMAHSVGEPSPVELY